MYFPWWHVPFLTAPMLIAMIAIVHVLVSHYAVGGGIFLASEIGCALRRGDERYLAYLRRHARFFVLLTVVFGAITGVGIWWTIGLSSPLATALLIRTFVFAWGIEWSLFLIEIVSAFILYYYWDRLSRKNLLRIARVYAIAAWLSLVVITAITAFMLNSGDWPAKGGFWRAVLNPQFMPQTIARTGGTLLLGALYVYLHASFVLRGAARAELRDLVQRRVTRLALAGVVLIGAGAVLWYIYMPDSARATLKGAAVPNVFAALLAAIGVILSVLLLFGPASNRRWMTPGFAIALFVMGLGAFSLGEFIREAVRKPYIIYNVVLGNQVMVDDVEPLGEHGYLQGGNWTRRLVAHNYPHTVDSEGKIDYAALLRLPKEDRVKLGGTIFQYHCNDCHAAEFGYSAIAPLMQGWSREERVAVIPRLSETRFFMPPWCGRDEEVQLLADYLEAIELDRPTGMLPE